MNYLTVVYLTDPSEADVWWLPFTTWPLKTKIQSMFTEPTLG